MNSYQAKSINLISFLSKLGIEPENIKKDQYWYYSPFRKESKPSLNIKNKENVWFDFGLGKGGTIIDFVMILKSIDFKESLKFIEQVNNGELQEKPAISNQSKKSKSKTIDLQYKTSELQNKILIDYLKNRKLNIEYCKKYLKEIYYKNNEKWLFGICIENQSKGFEVRNKYFKGTLGSKDITIIDGENSSKVDIFEGFIDFISYLTLKKIDILKHDTIILNSITNANSINLVFYDEINLFLDNDLTGNETSKKLEKRYINIIDKSIEYNKFKDYNDYLKSKQNSFFLLANINLT